MSSPLSASSWRPSSRALTIILAQDVQWGLRAAFPRLLGHQPSDLRLLQAQVPLRGPRSAQPWNPTRILHNSQGASSTWPKRARGSWTPPAPYTTRASPTLPSSSGLRTASTKSLKTKPKPGLWSGEPKPQTLASRSAWRMRLRPSFQDPVPPRQPTVALPRPKEGP